MADLGQTYNTDEMPSGEYDVIPAGWYQVMIVKTEGKNAKNGGWYVAIRFEIFGPTHAGRNVWSNLNLKNANSEAVRIACQNLGEINRALGLSMIKDTEEWHGRSLEIKLVIKNDSTYGEQNDVKGYRAIDGSASVPASSAAEKKKMPWQK